MYFKMKDLKNLKLVQLAESELNERQMNGLKGGFFCVCNACGRYGYSEDQNQYANSEHGYKTDGQCTNWWNWI